MTIYVPPACEVVLRGERIKLRMVQPKDHVRVTPYCPCDRGAARALARFPFAVNPSLCRLTTRASPDANLPTVLCAFQVIARSGCRTPLGDWAFFTQRVGNSLASRPAEFQGQPLTSRRTVSPCASSNRFRLIFPVESSFCACPMPGLSSAWGGWHGKCLRRADQDNSDQGGQQWLRLKRLLRGI